MAFQPNPEEAELWCSSFPMWWELLFGRLLWTIWEILSGELVFARNWSKSITFIGMAQATEITFWKISIALCFKTFNDIDTSYLFGSIPKWVGPIIWVVDYLYNVLYVWDETDKTVSFWLHLLFTNIDQCTLTLDLMELEPNSMATQRWTQLIRNTKRQVRLSSK